MEIELENKKLIRKLGIAFLIATALFAGVPAILDFILILKDKKEDFSFKHDHVVLGAGLATGLLMVLSPASIVAIINKFLPK